MKKQDYLNAVQATFVKAIEKREQVASALAEQVKALAADDKSDAAKELRDAHKSAQNRLNECETLSKFVSSESAMQVCFAHKIDFDALLNDKNKNTREHKKRFIHTFKAIAERNAEALKNDDYRFYSALFANRCKDKDLTLEKIQSEMRHQTTAQARYLKDFLESLNAATFNKEHKTLTIKRDSAIMQKIEALFS